MCAEEAAVRFENLLIAPAIREMDNPDLMLQRLQSRADELTPTMCFLVSVCSNAQYKDSMKPALDRLVKRYKHYAELVSEKLNCKKKGIETYVYMTITAVSNYMIFGEDMYIAPKMKLAKDALKNIA